MGVNVPADRALRPHMCHMSPRHCLLSIWIKCPACYRTLPHAKSARLYVLRSLKNSKPYSALIDMCIYDLIQHHYSALSIEIVNTSLYLKMLVVASCVR